MVTAGGWYLYGITRAPLDLIEPLQLLDCGRLAAVVRQVSLDDFSPAVLQERLQNPAELEAIVESHNRVIAAIHARQAILPAKFGSVYAKADEIVAALDPASDALLAQLDRLEGCDEWALHLYASRAVVRARVATVDQALGRLRGERAAARPGRAYFLEQQIQAALEAATRHELAALAQKAYDQLTGYAVAARANPVGFVADSGDRVEILRAAFLVARERTDQFKHASDSLRCESSGPWPPSSFA